MASNLIDHLSNENLDESSSSFRFVEMSDGLAHYSSGEEAGVCSHPSPAVRPNSKQDARSVQVNVPSDSPVARSSLPQARVENL